MRVAPLALVPTLAAIVAAGCSPLGRFPYAVGGLIGAAAGYYLAAIVRAVLEWMILMLIARSAASEGGAHDEPPTAEQPPG
ncbi:MAG: hypothetical protein AAFU85_26350 [Planctomycetota bacterium]